MSPPRSCLIPSPPPATAPLPLKPLIPPPPLPPSNRHLRRLKTAVSRRDALALSLLSLLRQPPPASAFSLGILKGDSEYGEKDVEDVQGMLRSASRDCVPEERNSFVTFQSKTGVEVCTFQLVLKNAASLLDNRDPIKLEAEASLRDLIRSFTSLNAVANETDIQIPSSRYGFFTNQETVLLVFPHFLVLADTLNVMRIEKCLESRVDCGVPHKLVNDPELRDSGSYSTELKIEIVQDKWKVIQPLTQGVYAALPVT
ncbi:hypothetical protein RHGRI_021998 [Rhododendron griersonianum]|uniref:Uncharacterized protein n=1 Tax=Rhododendron griersonianum TaxID=479676 RepID=A0AAV6JM74_9ERIC|nr:hypothetical protein RHGRI_021998 [Rhododendron griersonianum]